jgi:hypothetical protein
MVILIPKRCPDYQGLDDLSGGILKCWFKHLLKDNNTELTFSEGTILDQTRIVR